MCRIKINIRLGNASANGGNSLNPGDLRSLRILQGERLHDVRKFRTADQLIGIKEDTLLSLRMVHTAAILNGLSGVILGPATALVSAVWFPPGKRTTATGTSLIYLYNYYYEILLSLFDTLFDFPPLFIFSK